MDEDADGSQAVHILSKYHFANSLQRFRKGDEAIKYFNKVNFLGEWPRIEPPELIILSLDEGKAMDIATASRRDRLAPVPLVVVAGSKEEEDMIRNLNLPRTYCLCKPLGFFKLLEALQKLGMFWLVLKSPPGGA